ncbi:ribosome bioproteinsis protein ytm1 [Sporothrix bragantina]|uniref:Ribosome bioproteinsis protein ytm1 n=1 Tax=Sporothrix bragantina TaxID=671064 RepID=A0ABP0AUU7_9PEZI
MAASSAPPPPPSVIGQALVDFSVRGAFPSDNDVATAALRPESLPDAIRVLADAKTTLEAEIQSIVSETAGDVQAWIENAKALQVAIARRKTLAGDILVRANDGLDDERSEDKKKQTTAEAEAEAHARFLTGELNYNLQVRYLLEAIRSVSRLLDDVEQASSERRILDALRLLERAWSALDAMPVSKSCRAMRLLDIRAFELKADVHGVFDHVWNALVRINVDEDENEGEKRQATLTVNETRPDEPMSLSDAVIGLKAYKEVDHRMADLWHALDKAIVAPRMDLSQPSRPRIYVDGPELGLKDDAKESEGKVDVLFEDLDKMFSFLAEKLPADLVQSISSVMMPALVARIIDVWLASAVPTSLDQMAAFETTLQASQNFCARLTALHYSGFGRLTEWIESAPRVWLSKRREATLDAVRTIVAKGLGTPQQVEKVEKQMVSRSEGKKLAAAPAAAAAAAEQASDWNTAWSDEEEEEEQQSQPANKASTSKVAPEEDTSADDDGADEWGAWGDDDEGGNEAAEESTEMEVDTEPSAPAEESTKDNNNDDDDDAADAWGWGEEDAGDDNDNDEQVSQPTKPASPRKAKKEAPPQQQPQEPATREMVMKEKYYISSMPGPLLDLISWILEDGAALTSGDYEGSPVAAAAAGLFGLPALALAMFRAVSPHYYALEVGGSMYLYNDAMYLAERLAELAESWKQRLSSSSSSSMLRLDGEITKLQAFASRAYGREMAVQKTVLRDLLGGDQNVLQGSGSGNHNSYHNQHEADEDADDYVDAAVARVRSMAAAWEDVLAPSAWSQAVGALADAVAQKLILDVLDMPSISQDEAFGLANLIQKVTELDDLFRAPADNSGEPSERSEDKESVPMTSQYAPNWLRLQYLSEVLQSNLREVRYLWMESELSLYFTADEVVDLLRLSFEDNARSREVAREIAANPHPVDM